MKKFSLVLLIAGTVTVLFSSWGSLLYNTGNAAAYRLSVTRHQINLDGKKLSYHATAGYMPIKDKQDHPLARIFYVAYQTDSLVDSNRRPVTFVFNGGPGSAAIWLHMGSFGPARVLFSNDKGDAPAAAQYGDNPYSWMGFTDLVFIDPVATGYSQPADGVAARQFYNFDTDISSIGAFINNYLAQHHLQNQPIFLAGESYGTVRAVGLADYLQDQYHISLNGLTLISPAFNYQLISFHHGNETPYSYYLPSYAVASQYHHLLSPGLQQLSPEQLISRVAAFAQGTYTLFLNQGDAAPEALTNKVIDSLSYFTGLPKIYLRKVNARVSDKQFCRAVLQKNSLTIGGYDSRFTGSYKTTDPSESNLRGAFTSAFNNYIKQNLRYQNKLPYLATAAVSGWNYGEDANNSYLDVSETLKKVMNKNPNLKVNIVCGYYDLVTPVGSTEYVVRHLGIDPKLRGNINLNYYHSGHMIYISKIADAKFKIDGERFYKNALKFN